MSSACSALSHYQNGSAPDLKLTEIKLAHMVRELIAAMPEPLSPTTLRPTEAIKHAVDQSLLANPRAVAECGLETPDKYALRREFQRQWRAHPRLPA